LHQEALVTKWKCSQCHNPLTPQELSREESRGMEADREVLGQHGVCFSYYICSACRAANLFMDVHPVEGETYEEFRRRRDDLRGAVRQLDGAGAEVAFIERARSLDVGHHPGGRD
jgi:hypothetical protein